MVWVGRDLWTFSNPITLLKQVHLGQNAQDISSQVLSIFRERGSPASLGSLSVLCHSESKFVFPHIHMELPVVPVCSHCPLISCQVLLKKVWLDTQPYICVHHWDKKIEGGSRCRSPS